MSTPILTETVVESLAEMCQSLILGSQADNADKTPESEGAETTLSS
jgi:hypothetical protein